MANYKLRRKVLAVVFCAAAAVYTGARYSHEENTPVKVSGAKVESIESGGKHKIHTSEGDFNHDHGDGECNLKVGKTYDFTVRGFTMFGNDQDVLYSVNRTPNIKYKEEIIQDEDINTYKYQEPGKVADSTEFAPDSTLTKKELIQRNMDREPERLKDRKERLRKQHEEAKKKDAAEDKAEREQKHKLKKEQRKNQQAAFKK